MVAHGKHRVAAARIVLAVHPREREEVGELPHEEEPAEEPRARVELPRRRRPADHGGDRPADGADERVEGRARLERRVEHRVEHDVERRERRGQEADREAEHRGACVARDHGRHEDGCGADLARGQRTAACPVHQRVAAALEELVEERGARGRKRGARRRPREAGPVERAHGAERETDRGRREHERVEAHLREFGPDAERATRARWRRAAWILREQFAVACVELRRGAVGAKRRRHRSCGRGNLPAEELVLCGSEDLGCSRFVRFWHLWLGGRILL